MAGGAADGTQRSLRFLYALIASSASKTYAARPILVVVDEMERGQEMLDLAYLMLGLGAFGVLWLYALACERL